MTATVNQCDLQWPRSVRFYGVVVNGERHERAAWIGQAPQPAISDTARHLGRLGLWKDITVA